MQSQSSRTKSASSVPVSVHQCRTQCATKDCSLHNETYRCVPHNGAYQHTRAHDGSARGEFPSARVVNLGPSAALSLWLVLSRSFVRCVGVAIGRRPSRRERDAIIKCIRFTLAAESSPSQPASPAAVRPRGYEIG